LPGDTVRIAIGIEYDGRNFHGWETQRSGGTVQQSVESALSKVANTPIKTICAGRTDAGVHAVAQVAHFDCDAIRNERSWIFGCNSNLPKSVSVLWARQCDDKFHARFSAERRYYQYVILNRSVRPATLNGRVSWEYQPLDEQAMAQAATYLTGEHDFSAYRAAGCGARHAVRRIYDLTVQRQGSFVFLNISANAFLQHMVRNIAGVLMAIGSGQQSSQWAGDVLQSKDRRCAAKTASASGLYLTGVRYPQHYGLPAPANDLDAWLGVLPGH